jgi:hypothetical protein
MTGVEWSREVTRRIRERVEYADCAENAEGWFYGYAGRWVTLTINDVAAVLRTSLRGGGTIAQTERLDARRQWMESMSLELDSATVSQAVDFIVAHLRGEQQ